MVKVEIGQSGNVLHFSCKGHACYAQQGQPDIVCAAVSALSMTLVGALAPFAGFSCNVRSGDVSISCDSTDKAETILNTVLVGLHGLEEQYPHHVAIHDTRERPLKGELYVSI